MHVMSMTYPVQRIVLVPDIVYRCTSPLQMFLQVGQHVNNQSKHLFLQCPFQVSQFD